ncbi:MAG: ion transporter [Candidatus Hydrogenedentota bacterium]
MTQPGDNSDHFHPVIENIIFVAIVLVILQMIAENLAVIYHVPQDVTTGIIIAGFLFDLLFTLEFLGRLFVSGKRSGMGYYLKRQKGWIDFIASVPLLLLVSGPALLARFGNIEEGGTALEILMVMKTAKIIRVTRILRLIRAIRLFGHIHQTDSAMTNRHMGMLSTVCVVALIVVLAASHYFPFARTGDQHDYLAWRTPQLNAMIAAFAGDGSRETLLEFIRTNPINSDLIVLKDGSGAELYRSPDYSTLLWTAFHAGRDIPLAGGWSAVLSTHITDGERAKFELALLLCIIGVILFIMFGYAPIFAQQVSDPAFVMLKGLRNPDYNFEVRIREDLARDEIFQLARTFNEEWLPLKNRMRKAKGSESEEKSSLTMEDL